MGDCSIATGANSKIAQQEQGESTWDPLNASELAPNSGNGLIPSLIAWAKFQPPGNVAIVSFLTAKAPASSVYVHVVEAPSPVSSFRKSRRGPEATGKASAFDCRMGASNVESGRRCSLAGSRPGAESCAPTASLLINWSPGAAHMDQAAADVRHSRAHSASLDSHGGETD